METCPTCGRKLTVRKVKAALLSPDAMNDTEIFAYYKRTAPENDTRFFLQTQTRLNGTLRPRLEALLVSGAGRGEWYRELRAVQAAYWHEIEITEYPKREARSVVELGGRAPKRKITAQARADADAQMLSGVLSRRGFAHFTSQPAASTGQGWAAYCAADTLARS